MNGFSSWLPRGVGKKITGVQSVALGVGQEGVLEAGADGIVREKTLLAVGVFAKLTGLRIP